jgi:large subunit ribosomal protein L5
MAEAKYEPRLKTQYRDAVRKQMLEQFGYRTRWKFPV